MALCAANILQFRFVFRPSVRIRQDDKIAFEPHSGCVADLNDIAFALMKAAEAKLPAAVVIKALANHYETDVDVMAEEVVGFYTQMIERGFLSAEKLEASDV